MDHVFQEHDVRACCPPVDVARQNGLVVGFDEENIFHGERLLADGNLVTVVSTKCDINCTQTSKHRQQRQLLVYVLPERATGIRWLIRGMATLPQGNQEQLVVRDKVGRPPGEPGVSKSMECDILSLQCFDTVGWATGRASGL